MKRRDFFKGAGGAGLALGTGAGTALVHLCAFADASNLSRVEARYYSKLPDEEIECQLCPRTCRLGDKERGYCGVRENQGGTYYTLVYGKACSANVDPVEKKPFFHVLPGTTAMSIATAGCNVNCKFCQNWEISQVRPEQVSAVDLPPRRVADLAARNGCPSIAYTYTEPVVFYEYMYDTAVIGRDRGLKNLVVTAGHIKSEPLAELLKVVDAVKVDLKSFSPEFYKSYVRGELQPVLDTIRAVAGSGRWLEVVYLVIPTLNDNLKDIAAMSRWLGREVGPDVPLHFSRFYPMYLIKNLPPTPLSTLEDARRVALDEGLHYVYIGNAPGLKAENTVCPKCGRAVIERYAYQVRASGLDKGRCRACRTPIPGIWA
jgi:pyruvate formate lyase activating enzyme